MGIKSCQSFIDKIKVFQRTNLKYLHTNKEVLKRTYQNQDRVGNLGQTGVPPNGSRNYRSSKSNKPEHANRSSKDNTIRKPKCFICEEPHASFKCPLVIQECDENKLRSSLQEKQICIKCFCIHRDECWNSKKIYVCLTHKVHKNVCKCNQGFQNTIPLQNNISVY